MVPASILAVDLVVAAHDRAGLRTLDRDLECEQVGLAVRRRVDDRVQPVPVGLVAVERIVLERRDDTLALDAAYRPGAEDGGEERVLGVVLEVAAVARVAGEVDPAGQHDVEPPDPGLAAEQHAAVAGEVRVETRPDDDGSRQRGCARIVGAVPGVGDAHAGIARSQRRDAEPRHAGRVTGAHGHVFRDALITDFDDAAGGAHDADDHRESLVVGHPLFGLGRPGIGCLLPRFKHLRGGHLFFPSRHSPVRRAGNRAAVGDDTGDKYLCETGIRSRRQ